MKTHISIINIPEQIQDKISTNFDIKCKIHPNIGDVISIEQYVYNSDYKPIGGKFKFYYTVLQTIYNIIGGNDYNAEHFCEKTINVELTQKTIDDIKDRFRINEHLSSKNINFEKEEQPSNEIAFE